MDQRRSLGAHDLFTAVLATAHNLTIDHTRRMPAEEVSRIVTQS
jgi:hypothetical protein